MALDADDLKKLDEMFAAREMNKEGGNGGNPHYMPTAAEHRPIRPGEMVLLDLWGKLTRWVMQHPLKVAVPIVAALLLMIIPLTGIKFGGINETYLPPDSPTRVAQAQFDEMYAAFDATDADAGVLLDHDEHPRPGTTAEGLAKLRPVFAAKGSVTGPPASETSCQV